MQSRGKRDLVRELILINVVKRIDTDPALDKLVLRYPMVANLVGAANATLRAIVADRPRFVALNSPSSTGLAS